ncbi:hypothetical protein GCM10022381_04510 [Leifsonia kafniensis]|uniref:Uncharacterized protein n=1 Tax=Leifsonia kafniensis TaxID=475957 RepID=A0ABP7K413_9MICO
MNPLDEVRIDREMTVVQPGDYDHSVLEFASDLVLSSSLSVAARDSSGVGGENADIRSVVTRLAPLNPPLSHQW